VIVVNYEPSTDSWEDREALVLYPGEVAQVDGGVDRGG
jgi:hypothetical protein